MWFGTMVGLNRYDGYKFKVFKHSENNPNSLIDNFVKHLFEGPDKKMWVVTHFGVCIYDPATESFSHDIAAQLKKYRVFTDKITSIKKEKEGDYWLLTDNKGLYRYHPANKTTTFFSAAGLQGAQLHTNTVTDVIEYDSNFDFIVYDDGVIDKLDKRNNTIISRSFSLSAANNNRLEPYNGTLDNNGSLWLCASGSSSAIGVYKYLIKDNTLTHYNSESKGIRLNYNVINNIIIDNDNKVWIATDHGGINVIDPKDGSVEYLLSKEDDDKTLQGNSITLYKDNMGIIWAGTFKQGISYYHKTIIQFPLVHHQLSNPNSLPFNDVNFFLNDYKGNLWIGTNGGGLLYYNTVTKKYTQFKHDPANDNSISNNVVVHLFIDHEQKLWIGTYFGGLDCYDGKTFTHYRHSDSNPASISDDRVYSMIEDSELNLWVGTFTGSMNVLNRATNTFSHPKYKMLSEYTAELYLDRQKNIWIARDRGIDVIAKDKRSVRSYVNDPKNPNSLIANDVNSILQDSKGLFWIATKGGLSVLDAQTNKFYNIDETKGLPSNDVLMVVEDGKGVFWMSTGNGLASVKPVKTGDGYQFQIHTFDEFDGLQGREFNANAGFKTRDGKIMFGGGNGFNIFNPNDISIVKTNPALLLTDFQLFNKSVTPGDSVNGDVVLKNSITATKAITLNHNENDFSIEFADGDYFNPNKIGYQYKLEDFDKEWLSSSNKVRKATYTNLDAGDYVFKVRAININDPDNMSTLSLHITVLPPFWKSPVAYALYFVLTVCALFYIRHKSILKIEKDFKVKQDKLETERKINQEREEARRMHELDLMKIKFFTNVSHEFRTPLSLIISPIDSLLKSNDQPEQQHHLMMIKRNGRRLLNLVNQLLDFRKMEFNELKLNLGRGDIVRFIKDTSASFTDIANQNHIDYLFESEVSSLVVKFDHDKIERILFNLLSNAFKFTPSGGHVSVFLNLLKDLPGTGDQQLLQIKVVDTGIGIPKEKHEVVFERFFQDSMPESLLNQGSGIGLSITKEFVKMHGGDITVESEPGNGTCFTISLPVSPGAEVKAVETAPVEITKPVVNLPSGESQNTAAKKPAILIVEDNDDLRFYLKDNLKNSFVIIEAVNGKDGWQKALALHPDLVVSDVSMPEMTGIELCKKIKGDKRTAHLPVILLTALTEEKDQLTGLANGANDYITKPFNFEILLSKINGLLLVHKTLKKAYQKQVDVVAQDISIVSEDDKFLKNAFACIEKNITNHNFSVEELSSQLSLSRVSLYKKLLTLTGKTPVDCIRTIRLQRAAQLLEKSKLSIASVAYEVGFNNPTYFSKVFKDEYGMLPSEYITDLKKKEKENLETITEG